VSPATSERADPVDLDAEGAVLGAAMLGDPVPQLDGLTAADFTDPRHRDVYTAICDLIGAGEPVDPVTVLSRLRHNGTVRYTADRGPGLWLHDLIVMAPTVVAASTYRRAVIEAAVRRRVAQAFGRVAQAAQSDSFDTFSRVVRDEMAAVKASGQRLAQAVTE
jgi:replicative DNA helicase